MRYASVCSGVEAASLAWIPLGWEAVWFSEIEPFPCAVLKHRFPDVPNIGDMTKIHYNKEKEITYADDSDVTVPGRIDLLVRGTPCQGFSVAGKQGGLNDIRSVLCLSYIRLLEEIQPEWFVWENVPGVFSTNGGNDFKEFIRKITEVGYCCAWRVLDAQYVRVDGFPRAVPQRRRRVFVVGHIGTGFQSAAEVLFEPESLLGNTPPRRIKGKGFTEDSERGVTEASRHWDESGVNPTLNQCSAGSGIIGASNQELFSQNANGLVMDTKGVDARNGNVTGDTSMTVNCAATDSHHVPCVMDVNTPNGDEVSGTITANSVTAGEASSAMGGKVCCYDIGDRRRLLESYGVSPTLISKMGTGGNNVPIVTGETR